MRLNKTCVPRVLAFWFPIVSATHWKLSLTSCTAYLLMAFHMLVFVYVSYPYNPDPDPDSQNTRTTSPESHTAASLVDPPSHPASGLTPPSVCSNLQPRTRLQPRPLLRWACNLPAPDPGPLLQNPIRI